MGRDATRKPCADQEDPTSFTALHSNGKVEARRSLGNVGKSRRMAPLKLSCFKAAERDDASEISSSAASSHVEQATGEDNILYQDHGTVDATKQRLKRLLKKDEKNERALLNWDPEFRVLAKLFGEETATTEFRVLFQEYPEAALKLLPYFLNTLLYGFGDDVDARSQRYKDTLQGSARKKQSSTTRDSNTELGTASQLVVRGGRELELEEFVYTLCKKSVMFSLQSSWYFTSSMILGPEEMYHRTMTLLLGVESAVTTDKLPGDLFKRSEIEGPPVASAEVLSPRRRGKNTSTMTVSTHPLSDAGSDTIEPMTLSPEVTDVVLHADGDRTMDVRLQFKDILAHEKVALNNWLSQREDRGNFFHSELDFVKCLTDISRDLFEVPREHRREALRRELEKLNEYLPKNVFLPTESRSHRVLRLVPSEAFPFSTKERCPYLVAVEVQDMEDEAPESSQSRRKSRRRSVQLEDRNYEAAKFDYQTDVANSNVLGELESKKTLDTNQTDQKDIEGAPDPEVLKAWGESWQDKTERLRSESPHGNIPNWRLALVLVKAKDKLRQEMFAGTLVREFSRIFTESKLPLWVLPYGILATSADSGLMEGISDAKSIDSIKKNTPNITSLADWFKKTFGARDSPAHKRALKNFVDSMAGYSILCFVLQIKDRHNGNLMLRSQGHIVHIDFGFLLSNSPGGNFEFEKAPFKLSAEMLEVMGGPQSNTFKRFRKLCNLGYIEVCKYRTKLLLMVDMFYQGNEGMPCFLGGRDTVLGALRDRLLPGTSSKEKKAFFNRQINASIDNWTTKWYDRYQKCFTGIA